MESMSGKTAVVTGASSGIGRAIALNFARQGAIVYILGRSLPSLQLVADQARAAASDARMLTCVTDLDDAEAIKATAAFLAREAGAIDILVHSAAMHATGALQIAPVEDLDALYRVNVRAPYLLTQLLLPRLKSARGQIVFINSSQGISATAHVGLYAASKHALRAIADSLRDEVNVDGIRVLSVFLGRTATPTIERLYRSENRKYDPAVLLQPEDVAVAVSNSLCLPRTAELTNLTLRPLAKSYS